jgi:hypothetical protein
MRKELIPAILLAVLGGCICYSVSDQIGVLISKTPMFQTDLTNYKVGQ